MEEIIKVNYELCNMEKVGRLWEKNKGRQVDGK